MAQPALRHPAQAALLLPDGEEIAYGELDARARCIAGGLHARGFRPGDRVLLLCGNTPDLPVCLFGILYAGLTAVPLSVLSTPEQLRERARRIAVGVAVCESDCVELAEAAGLQALDCAELARGPAIDLCDVDSSADALVLHSSGTTGIGRAVRISHASLLLHSMALTHHTLGLTASDRVLGALPLTHSFGLRISLLCTFFAGAAVVLLPRFSGADCMEAMRRLRVSFAPMVPTMLHALVELPKEQKRPEDLRWVLVAGAPLAPELARRAQMRLGSPVRQGYGLTEATFCTIDDPSVDTVEGSVGRPVWGVQLRIAGGGEGEIEVKGQNLMSGYLDEPEATDRVMNDGWLRTGDIGRLDESGRLFILDRRKDLVIRGGYNVVPAEVESVLLEHPDVVDAAVVGRPDPHQGEEIVAVVVPRDGLQPEDLAELVRSRLGKQQWPREVALVPKIPVGPSGKVLKKQLREAIARGELQLRPISYM